MPVFVEIMSFFFKHSKVGWWQEHCCALPQELLNTSLVYLLVASESSVLHTHNAVSQFLIVIAKNAVTAQSTYFIPTFGPSEMSPTHLSRHFIYKTTIIRQTHIFTPLKENVFEANRRFDSRENNQYSP